MKYPEFFYSIESIILQDKLANFLGAFESGYIEFTYLDVVKSAGHSCPTVAGAYLMTLHGLKALFPNETPQRGEISVSFSDDINNGVTGVIANIITQITGATEHHGFKGINGKFIRHGLMHFNEDISSSIRFQRIDNGESVDVIYNPNSILPSPLQQTLMQKMQQGIATESDMKTFGELWQMRVQNIFENQKDVITIIK